MIQLTNVNRLFLLLVLGLGIFIIIWELAPSIANAIGTSGKNRTLLPVVLMVLAAIIFGAGAVWYYIEHPKPKASHLADGRGGNAAVEGNQSAAVGGNAGQSGLWPGGPGGDASVKGDRSYARGGAGSNAPSSDGRGGRAAKGPMEVENAETSLWKYGRGGIGANNPEYNRRMVLLTNIRAEYMKEFPDEKPFLEAGIDTVPINWVNKRLAENGETWRVELTDGGYVLPPLQSK